MRILRIPNALPVGCSKPAVCWLDLSFCSKTLRADWAATWMPSTPSLTECQAVRIMRQWSGLGRDSTEVAALWSHCGAVLELQVPGAARAATSESSWSLGRAALTHWQLDTQTAAPWLSDPESGQCAVALSINNWISHRAGAAGQPPAAWAAEEPDSVTDSERPPARVSVVCQTVGHCSKRQWLRQETKGWTQVRCDGTQLVQVSPAAPGRSNTVVHGAESPELWTLI